MKTVKYKLDNITLDGKQCIKGDNPIIRWETLSACVALVCVYPDGSAEFQIDDSIPGCTPCIRYFIECANCVSCPVYEKKICFCNTSDDCPDCTICVDGKCVEKCPDKLCDPVTEDCVDCIDDECPCDQVCVQGNCVCPDGKKKNDQGCCVACFEGEVNEESPCLKCIGGTWIQKQCPGAFVDPITCDCVECVNSADCSGDHECCVGGACLCCPGYILDPITKLCVEKPLCTKSTDCPPCENCVSGSCVPIVCPNGMSPVYNPLTGLCDCLKDCSCEDPQSCLSIKEICVDRNKDGQCNCYSCDNRFCDPDNPCEEGCICVGNQCIKNPCGQDCSNGGPCPPGCGCFEGTCVPCSLLSCMGTECSNAYGCKCNSFGSCVPSPCSGPCPNGAIDCGYGCGCQDGKCKDCSSVKCTGGQTCPDGCFCDEGTCAKNPCANKVCTNSDDCGEGCGCNDGLCLPCSSFDCDSCPTIEGCACTQGKCKDITTIPCNQLSCLNLKCEERPDCTCVGGLCQDGPNDGCTDKFYFEKQDCNLNLIFESRDCCPCEALKVTVEGTSLGGDNYSLEAQLTINGVKLSDLDIEDSNPNSGTIKYTVTQKYQKMREVSVGVYEAVVGSKTTIDQYSITYIDEDVKTITIPNIKAYGTIITIDGSPYRLDSRVVLVESSLEFLFTSGSGCRYTLPRQEFTRENLIVTKNFYFTKLTNCKRPIFTITKSSTLGGVGAVIPFGKKVYGNPLASNKWNYNLLDYTNFELEHGKYYRATVDCGCERNTQYDCPLIFCKPPLVAYDIEMTNCNKSIKFKKDVTVICDVYNQEPNKPVYKLYINDVLIDTRTLGSSPSTGNILYNKDEVLNSVDVVRTVRIVIDGDTCEECNVNIVPSFTELKIDKFEIVGNPCGEGDATANIKVSGASNYTFVIEPPVGPDITGTRTNQDAWNQLVPNESGDYTLTVTSGACSVAKTFTYVSTLDLDISISGNCDTQPTIVVANNTGFPITITATKLGESPITWTGVPGVSSRIVTAGQWTVVATYGLSCTKTVNLFIDCCVNSGILDGASVSYSCSKGLIFNRIVGKTLVKIGGNVVYEGGSINAGSNIPYTIISGDCIKEGTLNVPQCYKCNTVTHTCIPSTFPNKGFSENNCGGTCVECTDWDGITLTMSYDCALGLKINTSQTNMTVYTIIGGNIVAEGEILPPGNYSIIGTTLANGCSSSPINLVVPLCYSCISGVCVSNIDNNIGGIGNAYTNLSDCNEICTDCGNINIEAIVDCAEGQVTLLVIATGVPDQMATIDRPNDPYLTVRIGGIGKKTIKFPYTTPGTYILNYMVGSRSCQKEFEILDCNSPSTCLDNNYTARIVSYAELSTKFGLSYYTRYPNWTPVQVPLGDTTSMATVATLINNATSENAMVGSKIGNFNFLNINNPKYCLVYFEVKKQLHTTNTGGTVVNSGTYRSETTIPLIENNTQNQSNLTLEWDTSHRYPLVSKLIIAAKAGAPKEIYFGSSDLTSSVARKTLWANIKTAILSIDPTNSISIVYKYYTFVPSGSNYVCTFAVTNSDGANEIGIDLGSSFTNNSGSSDIYSKLIIEVDGKAIIADYYPSYLNKVGSFNITGSVLSTNYGANISCTCIKPLAS